jgi:hypothetical protein
MFVAMIPRRMRGLMERDTRRGCTNIAQIGPRPNITSGLRKRRYASRRGHGRAQYSPTVSVNTSPTPRRSRSPAVA